MEKRSTVDDRDSAHDRIVLMSYVAGHGVTYYHCDDDYRQMFLDELALIGVHSDQCEECNTHNECTVHKK